MTKPSLPEASAEILVPFHDVDMLGIVWHGHYLKYFEIARCVLFEAHDYSYRQMGESGYSWPVVDARVRYPRPAHFGQRVIVTARVAEWENRLKIDYEVRDAASGERLTKGYTVQVAVSLETREMCYESPQVLGQKLGII